MRPLKTPLRGLEDNIRMDLNKNMVGSCDWNHLNMDSEQWWAHVNAVMKFGFHKRRRIF
jgi:hypothetical protein